jgi:hypothetical protein
VRQIRMLRAMWRELETGLRPLLIGHEGGNLGHSQGATYGLPRQFPTLPRFCSGTTLGANQTSETSEGPFAPVGLNGQSRR